MPAKNGNSAQELQDLAKEAQEKFSDFGQQFSKGADEARTKLVEQLRELTERVEREVRDTDVSEAMQARIAGISAQVHDLTEYLDQHNVEQIGAQATKVVKENAWGALLVAFIIGLVIGVVFLGNSRK